MEATLVNECLAADLGDGADVVARSSAADPSSMQGCARCASWPQELICARADAAYWQAKHRAARLREDKLREDNKQLRAKLKQRERELFSRKSERRPQGSPQLLAEREAGPKRGRGQQPGRRGHGRRRHSHLPHVDEHWELPEGEQSCRRCGLAFEPLDGEQVSEEVEVEVRAYRRVIKRRCYRARCRCHEQPGLITAPALPRLIDNGSYGVSFWVSVLLDKFLFQRPTHRLLSELSMVHGLEVSQGTVTGGLKYLKPLFEPLYTALIERNVADTRWHADETRWLVFEPSPGKANHKWWLWVFQSSSSVVFKLEPTRSGEVVLEHFGQQAEGILCVDRYVAYKVVLRAGRMVLAFCWAHVRRDFLTLAATRTAHEAWGLAWVERIARLYALNRQRLAVQRATQAYALAQSELDAALDEMLAERERQRAEPTLDMARKKILDSLATHWAGLTVFRDHPEVPMDNNSAERALRNPVIGRKNYYGCGALWSAELAAMLFSLFQTLLLHRLNVRTWLSVYLDACRGSHGQAPAHACQFLPWHLSAKQRRRLSQPLPAIVDSS
jgi:transposase